MAQPIRCDWPDHDHLADVMVNRIDGSMAVAFCDEAFLAFAGQLLTAAMDAQDAPGGPEAAGDGSEPAQRPRGRSRQRSVPVPAVAVEEVTDPEPEPERPSERAMREAAAILAAGEPEPEPDREPVEA